MAVDIHPPQMPQYSYTQENMFTGIDVLSSDYNVLTPYGSIGAFYTRVNGQDAQVFSTKIGIDLNHAYTYAAYIDVDLEKFYLSEGNDKTDISNMWIFGNEFTVNPWQSWLLHPKFSLAAGVGQAKGTVTFTGAEIEFTVVQIKPTISAEFNMMNLLQTSLFVGYRFMKAMDSSVPFNGVSNLLGGLEIKVNL